jgi:hypothetical protein
MNKNTIRVLMGLAVVVACAGIVLAQAGGSGAMNPVDVSGIEADLTNRYTKAESDVLFVKDKTNGAAGSVDATNLRLRVGPAAKDIRVDWFSGHLQRTNGAATVDWFDFKLNGGPWVADTAPTVSSNLMRVAEFTNSPAWTLDRRAASMLISDGAESNEPVTVLQWQQGLSGNVNVYASTNKTLAYTNDFAPTNFTYLSCEDAVCDPGTILTVSAGTNEEYIFAWIETNKTYTDVPGHTVGGSLYISEDVAPRGATVKVEIYRYEPSTSNLFEWGDGGPSFVVPASATPQFIPLSIGVPDISTNVPFYHVARVKRTAGSMVGTDDILIGVGTNMATHFQFSVNTEVLLEPYLKKSGVDPMTGPLTIQQSSTNNCTFQWWAASNRWAMVQILNATTNVTFVSP